MISLHITCEYHMTTLPDRGEEMFHGHYSDVLAGEQLVEIAEGPHAAHPTTPLLAGCCQKAIRGYLQREEENLKCNLTVMLQMIESRFGVNRIFAYRLLGFRPNEHKDLVKQVGLVVAPRDLQQSLFAPRQGHSTALSPGRWEKHVRNMGETHVTTLYARNAPCD